MGWTSCPDWQRPKDVYDDVLSQYAPRADFRWEVIATRATNYGRHFWLGLRNRTTGEKMVVLYLIRPSVKGYGCAYKDVSESMGPCEVDCPLDLLEMTEPGLAGVEHDEGRWSREWRTKVRAYHAERKAKAAALRRLTVGARIFLVPGCTPQGPLTVQSVSPLRAWFGNMLYRVRRVHIERVEAV